jgi:hypothetical protein
MFPGAAESQFGHLTEVPEKLRTVPKCVSVRVTDAKSSDDFIHVAMAN